MTGYLARPFQTVKAIGRRRGDIAAHAERFLLSPRTESRRLWHYSHSDDRAAFLEFQRRIVLERVGQVEALRPQRPTASRGSPSQLEVNSDTQRELGSLLRKYGSDKATTHDYDRVYEEVARQVGVPGVIFEIGIGTTSERASSMGVNGSPGASARAFRDWGAQVVACDIDRSILFNAEGIHSFYVDQLRPRTFREALKYASTLGGIDLAVVDGLHTPEADVNSLIALVPLLTEAGLLMIEDVEDEPEITSIWDTVLAALPRRYTSVSIRTRACRVVLVAQRATWPVDRLERLYRTC